MSVRGVARIEYAPCTKKTNVTCTSSDPYSVYVVGLKKQKCIVKSLIFCTEFCLFSRPNGKSFFRETTLCACNMRSANFSLIFFDISKYIKYCIQIKGAYAPRRQNTTPNSEADSPLAVLAQARV
jgi:hypothetical protein